MQSIYVGTSLHWVRLRRAADERWLIFSLPSDGTAASYYYIMKTRKLYATSTELARGRAKRAALMDGSADESKADGTRRASAISTASFAPPGGSTGGAAGHAPTGQQRSNIANNLVPPMRAVAENIYKHVVVI